jgi:hypothetical protein
MVSLIKENELKHIRELTTEIINKDLAGIITQYLTINLNKLKIIRYLNNFFKFYPTQKYKSKVDVTSIGDDNRYFINDYYWNNDTYDWDLIINKS